MSNTVLPAYSRPSKFTYRLKQIKHFPQRLFCPCDAGVGTVRSFRITPKFDVKLEDVLNARHLPPLGLKEFEEYLLYVERSAENLYFWFWLKKYQETFAKLGGEDDNKSSVARELRESYACARATFFVAGAPLELNLSAETLDELPPPPLPNAEDEEPVLPDRFDAARRHVTDMLQNSLNNFVTAHSRNAGRNRGIFAIIVGLLVCAVGLAPILLSFHRHSRFLAFGALPCLWFGVGTMMAGLHGVCVVIFLFGDARQLYPYELVTPSEADFAQAQARSTRSRRGSTAKGSQEGSPERSHAVHFDNSVTRCDSRSTTGNESNDEKHQGPEKASARGSPRVVHRDLPAGPSGHADASVIAPFLSGPAVASPNGSSSGRGSFEWVIASSSMSTIEKRSRVIDVRAVWAPMAEVLSPIVRRGQWEIVIRSFVVGTVVAFVVCGICAAPFAGRRG